VVQQLLMKEVADSGESASRSNPSKRKSRRVEPTALVIRVERPGETPPLSTD